jgi:ClpP class serine protease
MKILDLMWLIIIISAFAPLIQRRSLESKRLATLRRIEVDRGSRVIALIHRQETLSILGFPIMRYILHTPGGLVLASEQVAHALLNHPGKVTVFIPHYAMSGGTLIALSADEIVMDENAVIGPVDPQVGNFPASSIIQAVESKPVEKVDDETLILADISRKAIRQVQHCVERILNEQMSGAESKRLARTLSTGKWTHDYPITCEEARELGLSVSTEVPEDIFKFMTLFPQPASRRPSVQYVPLPYRETPKTKE